MDSNTSTHQLKLAKNRQNDECCITLRLGKRRILKMVFTERFLIKKSVPLISSLCIKIFSYLRDLADVEVGQVEEEAPESQ